MKKYLIIVVVILFSAAIFPQSRGKYFDAPFGGGGGFTPGWIFPNFEQLNPKLKQFGVPELSNNGFFTTGGGGFVYIGFIKNLRIGGMGFGGSKSTTSTETPPIIIERRAAVQNAPQIVINKEVEYSLGGGGVTLEYTLPFVKNFGISLGAIIGGGSVGIEIYKNTGTSNWDNVWNDVSNISSENIHRTLKNNFWFFTPTINIDIPLYRFVSFRLGTGYQLTFADSWKVDNDQDLTNVPSDLNGNSFFIQTGIFIGFFGF